MKPSNQKGNVLLFIILAMTILSALGTGIYFLTTTSTFSGLEANAQQRAYQLAVAGRDYALARNLEKTTVLYPGGRTFTFVNGDKFVLKIGLNHPDEIISTGIVKEGTPYEARYTITATKPGFSSLADISFARDMNAMGVIQPTGAPGDFISKTESALSLGKIGSAYQSRFGAVIYGGNATEGNCVQGKCDFGTGFNAFFVFQFAAGSTGDGFTFAFFNGDNNNAGSVGGYSGSGEMMGYAGDSWVSGSYYLDGQGGRGIQPPKVAVEFDAYENAGTGCFSGRNDGFRNHMALVFWGDNATACTATVGRYTFDDNIHGAGTGGAEDPVNGLRPGAGGDPCSYFNGASLCGGGALSWPSDWLLDTSLPNVYAYRMEVRRKTTPEGSGNYRYRIKAWVKRCASGDATCTSDYAENSDYANTKLNSNDSYDYTADSPTLERIIEISPAYHARFEKMLFGWTTATGAATQNVNISRFKMNFLGKQACGGYGVWNNLGSPGSTSYFRINGAACTGVLRDALIGNIGPGGTINGYTDGSCTTAAVPSAITYSQAAAADANADCSVYYDATDK